MCDTACKINCMECFSCHPNGRICMFVVYVNDASDMQQSWHSSWNLFHQLCTAFKLTHQLSLRLKSVVKDARPMQKKRLADYYFYQHLNDSTWKEKMFDVQTRVNFKIPSGTNYISICRVRFGWIWKFAFFYESLIEAEAAAKCWFNSTFSGNNHCFIYPVVI